MGSHISSQENVVLLLEGDLKCPLLAKPYLLNFFYCGSVVAVWYAEAEIKKNQLCFTRIARNSLRLINLWPSDSRSNWNLEVLVYVKGGKPENPEKNPRSKDENQQQTRPTYGTRPESNPDHIGGRRALSPLRHPCSLLQ